MSCVRTDRAVLAAGLVLGLAVIVGYPDTADAGLAPEAIVRQADRSRGLGTPYRFRARIYTDRAADERRSDTDGATGERRSGSDRAAGERRSASRARDATVVEIRSDGFAKQLILVLQPNRGDVLLKVDDTIWLRPRRLHRLTRIPPDLRMFNGAATADVTAVDLLKTYAVAVHGDTCSSGGEYVLDLVAAHDGVRYPRATYWVGCDAVPRRIDFMASSGKVLKSIEYGDFADVLGARIATRLVIEDHIFRDVSIVAMSEFARLDPDDVAPFSPDYLLAMPEPTID